MQWLEILNAAGSGDLGQLTSALDNGCDPNTVHPEVGNTPLYNACFGNKLEAVVLLLERGADPNKKMQYVSPVDGRVEDGLVALMVAQTPEIAAVLLAHGADPNSRRPDGITPLMRQVFAGRPDVVRTLLDAGADAGNRDGQGRSASDIARERIRFMQENNAIFRIGHAGRRIRQFKTIIGMLEDQGA